MRAAILCVVFASAACGSSDVSREVGARCTTDADCDDRCLTGDHWPDGFCTISCTVAGDCPDHAWCIKDDGADGGVCAFQCASESSCMFLNGGYTCQERDNQEANPPKVMVCRG